MQAVLGVVRGLAGGNLREIRDTLTWKTALYNGVAPIPQVPILIPFKIGFFVVFLIIFLALGASWWSLPLAYAGQAIAVALLMYSILNFVTSWII